MNMDVQYNMQTIPKRDIINTQGTYPKYWFISDLHLYHKNIIRYCNRPFKSVGEMNYYLMQNWNKYITDDDIVFYLGDFCFKVNEEQLKILLSKFKGQKIFIRGNHDNDKSLETCIENIEIYLNGKHILLIHDPYKSRYGYDLVLCGHVHDKWKFKTMEAQGKKWNVVNVSVDVWNFTPVTIDDILREYGVWKAK